MDQLNIPDFVGDVGNIYMAEFSSDSSFEDSSDDIETIYKSAEQEQVSSADVCVDPDYLQDPTPIDIESDQNTIELDDLVVYPPLSDLDPIIVPTTDMVFNSRDEAFALWKLYALRTGFAVGSRTMHRLTGDPYTVTYSCSRGRMPRKNRKKRNETIPDTVSRDGYKKRNRGETFTNCGARIIVEDLMIVGEWKIGFVELDHNHSLNPKSARFFKCHRNLPEFAKIQLRINDLAGVPPKQSIKSVVAQAGGIDKCGFIARDCYNVIQRFRHLRMADGDANNLMNFFSNRRAISPNFFYACELSPDGRLSKIFWADARCRELYRHFGDVITFDTTYLTNKYEMPWAPFVGINNHGQSTILGCALLSDETTETYIWLLNTWLQCMGGVPPAAIITDQCGAICNAVATVFPMAAHRLCLWHVMKKVPQKIGNGYNRAHLIPLVKSLVYESPTEEAFESGWMEITHGVPDGERLKEWLLFMYQIRKKWVPVFLRGTFWGGMCSTQRSEGMNSFFKGYVNSRTTLTIFVDQFERAIHARWHSEKLEDFNNHKETPHLISAHPFEAQLASKYTHNLFYRFQEELKQLINLHSVLTDNDSHSSTVSVCQYYGNGFSAKETRVVVSSDDRSYVCPCHLFITRGVVCRHALAAYRHLGVREIPEMYILSRWSCDIKRTAYLDSLMPPTKSPSVKEFNDIFTRASTKLLSIIYQISSKPLKLDEMFSRLDLMHMEIVAQKNPTEAEELPTEPIILSSHGPIETEEQVSTCYKEPLEVRHVGRPRDRRLKSYSDKPKPRPRGRPSKKNVASTNDPGSSKKSSSTPIWDQSQKTSNDVAASSTMIPLSPNGMSHTGLLMSYIVPN